MKELVFVALNKEDIQYLIDEFDLGRNLRRYMSGELNLPTLVYRNEANVWSHQGLIGSSSNEVSWGGYGERLSKAMTIVQHKQSKLTPLMDLTTREVLELVEKWTGDDFNQWYEDTLGGVRWKNI